MASSSSVTTGLPAIHDYWTIPGAYADDAADGEEPPAPLTEEEQLETANAALLALNNSTYGSFFELLEAVNDRAQDCGFAIRKRRSNNIDKATGLPTRIDLECHHSRFYGDVVPAHRNKEDQIGVAAASDGSDDEESVRQKYRGTKLSGCAWKAKAVFLKAAQVWVFVIRESDHNHEPDENPWDITIHRKRRQKDEKFRKRLFELAMVTKATGADVAEQLMTEFPLVNVRSQDVWMACRARRLLMQGLCTSFQAFLHILMNDPNIVVVIRREGEDQDDEDSKIDGIWWTYKWCIEQWRLNPELLSGDATYNVNDFGMPLFQLNGITSIYSTFNVYWALIGNESAEMFTWVLQTVRSVAIDYKIALPSVIVSDYDMGFKNAAYQVFPTPVVLEASGQATPSHKGTKYQLCLWHVLKNVAHNVKLKYNGSLEGTYLGETGSVKGSGIRNTHDRDPTEYIADDGTIDVGAAIVATMLLEPHDRRQRGQHAHNDPYAKPPPGCGRAPRDSDRTYTDDADGVVCAIRDYIYLKHDGHDEMWARVRGEFPSQQESLDYWEKYYIPFKKEICTYYTSQNRNYGITATSRSEGSHAVLKKLLKNRKTDLNQLHTRIVQLTRRIQHNYKDRVGIDRRETLSNRLDAFLYKHLFKHVPKIALLKIEGQAAIARERLKEKPGEDFSEGGECKFEVRCLS